MSLTQQVRRANADQDVRRASNEFIMLAKCLAVGGDLPNALEYAKQNRAVERVQEVLKAAVAAGTTTDTAWASALVPYQSIANGFLESLRNQSAYQSILSDGGFRVVPFKSRLGVVSVGAVASRIGEMGLKPISRISVTSDQLDQILKAVCIVVVSSELARFSGPVGNQLIGAELRGAVSVETDTIFFAELLTTSVPSVPSSGNSAADAWSDIAYLFGSVPLNAQSSPYFVAGPVAARSLATRTAAAGQTFPDLGVQGGTMVGVPLLISDGVAEDQLVLLDGNKIAVADGGITLDSSTQASIPLSDDGAGAPMSLWQQNATGIRCERTFSMQALTDNAVAYVSSVGAS